ncbi:transposase [Streptococcus pneumoniae]|nr:transposase [Streptococcus pneumoniae]
MSIVIGADAAGLRLKEVVKDFLEKENFHLVDVTAEDKAYNHALSKERSKVENIFAKVKTFKMISTTYRNHRKRFGLRMNLIAGIINHELEF